MNGYERMVAALTGQPVDKIPVMLHNFMVAAREINVTMKQFRDNPKVIADAFIKSVEKYGLDGVLIDIDTVTLAGSLGVPVDFPEDSPARSHQGCLNALTDIKLLKPANVENYKYIQIWLESVRLVKEYFGDTIMVRGNCDQSPFSLAGLVRGSENWMIDLYMEELSQIHELLDYTTEATCQFIRLMAQTGAHMLSNGDSLAGPDLVAPEIYKEYALPYEMKVVKAAHDLGLFYTLHICGDTGLILNQMLQTEADAFEIDYKTDVYKAYEILHDKATFTGNIDPGGVLARGTPELVRKKTLELLDIFSRTERFILNSGCALPADTPEINLKTFVETAREYIRM